MTSRLPEVLSEITALEAQLSKLKQEASELSRTASLLTKLDTTLPMKLSEYRRYGRQMILPGVGLPGQLKLKRASVLVVGAGGLGCPALQYLAGAGVGHIGIVDHDTVELSNLHRQILHTEDRVDQYKVESAKAAMLANNSAVRVTTYPTSLTTENALEILRPYSLILDCTDLPLTRYLISDACVLLGKPLVSGAALGFNGQLTVYNLGEDSPCYRCVWPKVARGFARGGTCEDEGVLGGVTGVIGTMMAVEAVKILTGLLNPATTAPTLLIYSALLSPAFRSVKLRKRRPNCRSCGTPDDAPGAMAESTGKILDLVSEDYVAFCGGPEVDWATEGLSEAAGGTLRRASVKELAEVMNRSPRPKVIDVRSSEEFSIVSLSGSINIPLRDILSSPAAHLPESASEPIYVICRRGNDSKSAAEALASARREKDAESASALGDVVDVRGGLAAWGREVVGDEAGDWPRY